MLSAASWATLLPEQSGWLVGTVQLETFIVFFVEGLDGAISEGSNVISNAFDNTFVIVVHLGSGSEDEYFDVEDEPPKWGRICCAFEGGLL